MSPVTQTGTRAGPCRASQRALTLTLRSLTSSVTGDTWRCLALPQRRACAPPVTHAPSALDPRGRIETHSPSPPSLDSTRSTLRTAAATA
eukprot:8200843-Alexandrium_andersonii.AAC.1